MTGTPQEQQDAAPKPDASTAPAKSNKPPKDETFEQKMDKLSDKYKAKTKELRKKFSSTGSIGKGKADVITARQQNRLSAAINAKHKEYKNLSAEKKKERMSLILGQTEQELVNIHTPYERILNNISGLNRLDDTELVKVEAVLEAVSRMKASPKIEQLFLKALNKESFTPQDLELLVNEIKPNVLNKATNEKESKPIFETCNVGAIIGVMEERTKMALIETIIAKKTPADSMQILESFIVSGVISNVQLEHLIKNVIPEPNASALQKRLDEGEIQKKQRAYQDKIMSFSRVNRGRTAENPVTKMASGAGAMAIAGVWGIAVALVNVKANWDWSQPGKSLADTLTNPYFLLGTAAAVGGVVATTSVASPEKYEKWKDKIKGFMSGPQENKDREAMKKAEVKEIMEEKMAQNPSIMNFLIEKEETEGGSKKTGLDIIKEYASERRNAKKPIDFNLQDLKAKCGPKQKKLLDKAFLAEGGKPINFQDTMGAIMVALTAFKLDNPTALKMVINDIKRKQGIPTT